MLVVIITFVLLQPARILTPDLMVSQPPVLAAMEEAALELAMPNKPSSSAPGPPMNATISPRGTIHPQLAANVTATRPAHASLAGIPPPKRAPPPPPAAASVGTHSYSSSLSDISFSAMTAVGASLDSSTQASASITSPRGTSVSNQVVAATAAAISAAAGALSPRQAQSTAPQQSAPNALSPRAAQTTGTGGAGAAVGAGMTSNDTTDTHILSDDEGADSDDEAPVPESGSAQAGSSSKVSFAPPTAEQLRAAVWFMLLLLLMMLMLTTELGMCCMVSCSAHRGRGEGAG